MQCYLGTTCCHRIPVGIMISVCSASQCLVHSKSLSIPGWWKLQLYKHNPTNLSLWLGTRYNLPDLNRKGQTHDDLILASMFGPISFLVAGMKCKNILCSHGKFLMVSDPCSANWLVGVPMCFIINCIYIRSAFILGEFCIVASFFCCPCYPVFS